MAAEARKPWYRRVPGALVGLLALGAGMALGTLFPSELGFIGRGVNTGFGWLAFLAPGIIFFTIAAAIVDMQRTGKGGRFALWVTIAFTVAGLLAAFIAILLAVPIFRLPWGAGGASGKLFGSDMSFREVVEAHLTNSLIAVLYAAGTMVLLHRLSRYRWAKGFARPTMDVVRMVGVEGMRIVGHGIKAVFPFLLLGIGIFIPTKMSQTLADAGDRISSAGGLDTVVGTDPVALYFLTVWIQVVVLFTFLGLITIGVCWYTGFSLKRFFKEYLAYVYPFAWATSSSAASIPVNLERTEALGVRKEVRDFVIPLGATVNLDGAIVAAFIITPMAAILTGYTPTFVDLLLLVIPVKLVTMGVPGIPGGIAIVVPPIVAEILPIPPESKGAFLAIWFGFSVGLSDQFRTGVNTTTNGVVALLFEHLYPKHFSRETSVPVVTGADDTVAVALAPAEK